MTDISPEQCLFCEVLRERQVVAELRTMIAVYDKYPVTDGHLLIIPKRHVVDYFDLSHEELRDAEQLLLLMKEKALGNDSTVQGFNVGVNCGPVAGQTVMHAHIHLIPRRKGDVDDPRGGIRGCVPSKMKY